VSCCAAAFSPRPYLVAVPPDAVHDHGQPTRRILTKTIDPKEATVDRTLVRFSNRPFRVKHFQTIRRCSVDVAHGLTLLFGIGAKALPLWDSRMRGAIFAAALPS